MAERKERLDATAWLARHLVGPAQVTDPRVPGRGTTDAERAREGELQAGFERVRDASGRVYLVAKDEGA
ncbi:hypothetical protein [Cellulomonas xiejunii]|uniref:Uncharacterized protein n=1 Tax=Cellulomonas xiejunii TaxID=2968083 RepID=A0ABY5KJD4_9CELL|nr:hypothetical protein [Cellulomonas xiejunii]MCC2320289.1 hypothetical protein [Cellulomonas xiejunii]UUI70594.1 hypothetical protein NP048_12375 [Cellulomonas xiejunii]